jgi:hypothetical protein
MANGHSGKPKGQGGMKPAPMPHPGTSGVPSKGEAPKSEQKRGVHVPGIGGSKKSF